MIDLDGLSDSPSSTPSSPVWEMDIQEERDLVELGLTNRPPDSKSYTDSTEWESQSWNIEGTKGKENQMTYYKYSA